MYERGPYKMVRTPVLRRGQIGVVVIPRGEGWYPHDVYLEFADGACVGFAEAEVMHMRPDDVPEPGHRLSASDMRGVERRF